MKQLFKRLSSAVLILSLLLGMSVSALAADTIAPSRVTLDKTAATVYLHDGKPIPVDLTAIIQPSDFDGSITWSAEENSQVCIASSDKATARVSAVDGAGAGSTGTVTVTATTLGVSKSATCKVTIKEDVAKSTSFGPFTVEAGKTITALPTVTWESGVTDTTASDLWVENTAIADVSSSGAVIAHAKGSTKLHATVGGKELTATLTVTGVTGITLNRSTLNLSVGDASVALTATIKPDGLNYTPTFTTSDASVATVSADGKVTAKKAGAAVITAKITDSSGTEYTASCTVSVTTQSGDVSASVNAGSDLSFKDIQTAISNRYSKAGGSGNPMIAFNSVGSSAIGTLYETSAKTKTVDSGYYCNLSLLGNLCFAPAAAGHYTISYTVSSAGKAAVLSGTITIEVKNAVKNIHIGVTENADYFFATASVNGSTGVKLLSDAIGAYGSLRFGSISSGSGAGSLYVSQNGSAVRNGTIVNSGDVGALYYSASRGGSYQIGYSAYSGANATGTLLASGTLTLGTGSDSLNVVVTLDEIAPYSFSSSTRRNSSSAAAMLRSAINANVGSSSWSYVRFNDAASTNTCNATLYTDSDARYAVNGNTYVAYSDLTRLYFVPAQSGVFELGYSVYDDTTDASALASGKLRITASSLASGTAALYFTTTPGGKLSFTESDFATWYTSRRTSSYHLEYVQFGAMSRSFGTFYDGGTAINAPASYVFFTSDYYLSKSSGARRLSDLSFLAPSYAGYLELPFTCYGRVGSNGSVVQEKGALRIFVTASSVPDVVCAFGGTAAVSLKESAFADAYRSATASSAASPAFYIQLMEVPASGTLYENYNKSTGRGTALTSSTVDLAPYHINGGSGTTSVSTLAYLPSASGANNSSSIRYIAFSADGSELYSGRIAFRYDADASSLNVTDGYTFRVSDLCNDADARYVVFNQPSLGKLFVNYRNGRGTPLPGDARLYVSSASDGSYPITSLTYIPRSDMENKTVDLSYTVYTSSRSYPDTLTLKVNKKTSSASFSDVLPEKEGSWAANAIDYASKWGLVNGTGNGKFSPGSTMRRCDLVLILYRNAGSPAVSGNLAYTDVPADAYYRDSALWAANNGIMAGVVTGKTYSPNTAVTRESFARILYNYAAASGASTAGSADLSAYKDSGKIASYAKDAMAWAVSKGYINGTSATTLSPSDTATRAQIATLLHRYLTL